jgi:hypothetical protein
MRYALDHLIDGIYGIDEAIRHEGASGEPRRAALELFAEVGHQVAEALAYIGGQLEVELDSAYDA